MYSITIYFTYVYTQARDDCHLAILLHENVHMHQLGSLAMAMEVPDDHLMITRDIAHECENDISQYLFVAGDYATKCQQQH